jgi:predicted nucleic acid-binding protein
VTVVSNSSPLISLTRIGKLGLLPQLYDEVYVPEAVWHEVAIAGEGQPGVNQFKEAAWIKRVPVKNRALVRALQRDLDAGESEAIALAVETEAELLIMDERLGRDTARIFELKYTGVVGVLIEAKRKGLIEEIRPVLDEMREKGHFRISSVLYARILQDEGEEEI